MRAVAVAPLAALLACALACASGSAEREGLEFSPSGCASLREGETTEAQARAALVADPVEETRAEDGRVTARWSFEQRAGTGLGTVLRPIGCAAAYAAGFFVPGAGAACGVIAVAGAGPSASTETGQTFECVVTFQDGLVESFSYSRGREHREGAGF